MLLNLKPRPCFNHLDLEVHVFRILQEALNNAARHAGVNEVTVELQDNPLRLRVADAGPGALVLFRMRRGAIAKHIGILTGPASGPASFLHSYEGLGVVEEPLTPTWARRIALAFLFPAPSEGY